MKKAVVSGQFAVAVSENNGLTGEKNPRGAGLSTFGPVQTALASGTPARDASGCDLENEKAGHEVRLLDVPVAGDAQAGRIAPCSVVSWPRYSSAFVLA